MNTGAGGRKPGVFLVSMKSRASVNPSSAFFGRVMDWGWPKRTASHFLVLVAHPIAIVNMRLASYSGVFHPEGGDSRDSSSRCPLG